MSESDQHRHEELTLQYPDDRCRQIARYVLDSSGVPDEDRVCAAGILNALEAAEHARDLTVLEVGQWQLRAAAAVDAERLWSRYGEGDSNDP